MNYQSLKLEMDDLLSALRPDTDDSLSIKTGGDDEREARHCLHWRGAGDGEDVKIDCRPTPSTRDHHD